jgi:hypothetical protein
MIKYCKVLFDIFQVNLILWDTFSDNVMLPAVDRLCLSVVRASAIQPSGN